MSAVYFHNQQSAMQNTVNRYFKLHLNVESNTIREGFVEFLVIVILHSDAGTSHRLKTVKW